MSEVLPRQIRSLEGHALAVVAGHGRSLCAGGAATVTEPEPRDEYQRIATRVMEKLGGRLRGFGLDLVGGRLVLRGDASSYHVKQLAQHEVMSMTDRPILSNRIVVRY